MAALDQLDEFRPDLARHLFADAAMLVDVAPLADQVEMVGIRAVAAQHAVLHLRRRAVERVVVAVVEFVEQLDELVAAPRLHLEIIDVEVVPLRRQRYQSHCDLLLHFTSSSRRRPGPTFPVGGATAEWVPAFAGMTNGGFVKCPILASTAL